MELATPQEGLWPMDKSVLEQIHPEGPRPMDKPQRNYSLCRTHASTEETSKKEGAVEEQDEKL